MPKTLMLLVLCAPLGWLAWKEVEAFGEVASAPPLGVETSLTSDRLSESRLAAIRVPDQVVGSFLTLGPAPDGNPSGELTPTLLKHARARAALDDSPKIETARNQEAETRLKLEAKRRDLLNGGKPRDRAAGPGSLTPLKTLLDGYKKLDAFDSRLAEEVEAEFRLASLDLDAGPLVFEADLGRYADWTPGQPRPEPSAEDVGEKLNRFKEYFNRYGGGADPGPSETEVHALREREGLWRDLLRLAELFDEPNRGTRLTRAADLAEEENHPESLRRASRRLALSLAEEYLPIEPLDRIVLVVGDVTKRPEPFDRKDLMIFWHTLPEGTRQGDALEKSGRDEFSIARDEVVYFAFSGGSREVKKGQEGPPLAPTPYSKAIAGYNALRAKVKPEAWSVPFLRDLLEYARARKDELARAGSENASGSTLVTRIQEMIDLVGSHPTVFPGP